MLGRFGIVALVAGCGRIGFEHPSHDASEQEVVVWRETKTTMIDLNGALAVSIPTPHAIEGDLWIAMIAMGSTGDPQPASFTPPPSWSQLLRVDRLNDTALVGYSHVASASEPTAATWGFSQKIEGVAWISAYAGVATATPIAADMHAVDDTTGPSYATPPLAGVPAGAVVLATFVAHGVPHATWVAPGQATTRATIDNGDTRSGLGIEMPNTGTIAPVAANASVTQDYALVDIMALAP